MSERRPIRWFGARQPSALSREPSFSLLERTSEDGGSANLVERMRGFAPTFERFDSLMTQPPEVVTSLGHANSPFEGLDFDGGERDISSDTLLALRNNITFDDLVKVHAEDVITVLDRYCITYQGSFTITDSDALHAFHGECMLTRDLDEAHDDFFEENWREIIAERVRKQPDNLKVGWEEPVTICAYVVSLKDLANLDKSDLIRLLLQKSDARALPKAVWGFNAVRAVIDYHWQHWVKRLLLIGFLLFLLWTISFGAYIALYIESDRCPPLADAPTEAPSPLVTLNRVRTFKGGGSGSRNGSAPHGPESEKSCDRIRCAFDDSQVFALWTAVLNIICFACMIPFAAEEYYTLFTQGLEWFSVQNLIDFATHTLQLFIFACHVRDYGLLEEWFGNLIALQAVLLSIRTIRFFRLLGEGTTFFDTAVAVIYDVRYWIVYIVATGVVASFALGALYKPEFEFRKDHRDFRSLKMALITTFQIIFGSFEASYIVDAKYQWIKAIFFFGFQLLMTITVLNLVIAAMSEAYLSLASDKLIRLYRGRAQVIDEYVGLRLPKQLTVNPKPYIHFIIRDDGCNKPTTGDGNAVLETVPTSRGGSSSVDDLRKEVKDLSTKLDSLIEMMQSGNRRSMKKQ